MMKDINDLKNLFFCLYKYLNLPMPTYDSKREWCRKTDMLKCELFMSKSKFNVLSPCKCRLLTCKMLMSTCDITKTLKFVTDYGNISGWLSGGYIAEYLILTGRI